jgi:excisionase family DNA binding protein
MANKQLEVQRMLSYPQVCELMGFSRSTLVKLVDARKIKAVKIGKSRRVWSEDLQAYIDSLRGDARIENGRRQW